MGWRIHHSRRGCAHPQLGKTMLSGLLAVGAWDRNPGEVSGPQFHPKMVCLLPKTFCMGDPGGPRSPKPCSPSAGPRVRLPRPRPCGVGDPDGPRPGVSGHTGDLSWICQQCLPFPRQVSVKIIPEKGSFQVKLSPGRGGKTPHLPPDQANLTSSRSLLLALGRKVCSDRRDVQ